MILNYPIDYKICSKNIDNFEKKLTLFDFKDHYLK